MVAGPFFDRVGRPGDAFSLGDDWQVTLNQARWETSPYRVVAELAITNASRRPLPVEDLYPELFRRAAMTLRESIWTDARSDSVWDPIRDTTFYRQVVMNDPNSSSD
ncbi:MAG: hypothetical protein HYU41_00790 [Candidatus Rokubacteria bacterium]|nr:hypothetical protein [Candidatus Rokubacteria bacterium]